MTLQDEIRLIGKVAYKIGENINGRTDYSVEKTFEYFEALGRITNPNFKIHEIDHAVIFKLVNYFIENKEECEKNGMDLDKGILIFGSTGMGKTTWLQIAATISKKIKNLPLISCSELAKQCSTKGIAVVDDIDFEHSFILDDIGSEQKARFYGNEIEVVSEVLKLFSDRKNTIVDTVVREQFAGLPSVKYNTFRPKIHPSVKIFATTNCSLDDLSDRYGPRVHSRMAQIFNIVNFDSESIDKRLL